MSTQAQPSITEVKEWLRVAQGVHVDEQGMDVTVKLQISKMSGILEEAQECTAKVNADDSDSTAA